MKNKIKKEIVCIDGGNTTGELYYGYTNKQEVLNEAMKISGEVVDEDFLYKVRVFKTTKDGEDYYYFGEKCPTCNCKVKGVLSYFHGDL